MPGKGEKYMKKVKKNMSILCKMLYTYVDRFASCSIFSVYY